jgi:hypothetical protein
MVPDHLRKLLRPYSRRASTLTGGSLPPNVTGIVSSGLVWEILARRWRLGLSDSLPA